MDVPQESLKLEKCFGRIDDELNMFLKLWTELKRPNFLGAHEQLIEKIKNEATKWLF